MAKVKKYVKNPEFQFEVIVKVGTPSKIPYPPPPSFPPEFAIFACLVLTAGIPFTL